MQHIPAQQTQIQVPCDRIGIRPLDRNEFSSSEGCSGHLLHHKGPRLWRHGRLVGCAPPMRLLRGRAKFFRGSSRTAEAGGLSASSSPPSPKKAVSQHPSEHHQQHQQPSTGGRTVEGAHRTCHQTRVVSLTTHCFSEWPLGQFRVLGFGDGLKPKLRAGQGVVEQRFDSG